MVDVQQVCEQGRYSGSSDQGKPEAFQSRRQSCTRMEVTTMEGADCGSLQSWRGGTSQPAKRRPAAAINAAQREYIIKMWEIETETGKL